MRFGDRISARNLAVLQRRRNAYDAHIRSLRFKPDDPVYRYFAADVFHDSEIHIESMTLTNRELSLSLQNTYAINKVCNLGGVDSSRVDREDFSTLIHFRDAVRFQLSDKGERGVPRYYRSSEIDRRQGDLISLNLSFIAGSGRGVMRMLFSSVEVEDISKKIRKYLPPKANPASFLSYYPDIPETRMNCAESRQ